MLLRLRGVARPAICLVVPTGFHKSTGLHSLFWGMLHTIKSDLRSFQNVPGPQQDDRFDHARASSLALAAEALCCSRVGRLSDL